MEDTPLLSGTVVSPQIKSRLYTSHVLSTFNDRVFQFGSILFIAECFPNTLLPASLYAVVRSVAAIVLSPSLGRYVDKNERLGVVRNSIVFQRISVLISSIIFLLLLTYMKDSPPTVKWGVFLVTIFLAGIERLCAIGNYVAIERDWVIVIADGQTRQLEILNAQMRRIDLICKLFGPLFISLVAGIDMRGCILFVIVTNLISVNVEYFAIAKVYNLCPALAEPKTVESNQTKQKSSFISYISSEYFLPSFALSLLYLTVLSFGGSTTVYLISQNLTPTVVGLLRTGSAVFEISATWIAPWAQRRIGSVRAAMWSITFQICMVIPILVEFAVGDTIPWLNGKQKWVLAAMIAPSRIGLWGFDLSVRRIIQEGVPSPIRGSFSATEASFQNIFELLGYATTMIFYKPQQMLIPVAISVGSISFAGIIYGAWFRGARPFQSFNKVQVD